MMHTNDPDDANVIPVKAEEIRDEPVAKAREDDLRNSEVYKPCCIPYSLRPVNSISGCMLTPLNKCVCL